MTWKTPKIVEVPVGMEINMYACAARQIDFIENDLPGSGGALPLRAVADGAALFRFKI